MIVIDFRVTSEKRQTLHAALESERGNVFKKAATDLAQQALQVPGAIPATRRLEEKGRNRRARGPPPHPTSPPRTRRKVTGAG